MKGTVYQALTYQARSPPQVIPVDTTGNDNLCTTFGNEWVTQLKKEPIGASLSEDMSSLIAIRTAAWNTS